MKFNWKHKLRSGALQFTVFISVVIALILAGVILLAYTHRFFIEQSKAIVDNIQLADSGIESVKTQQMISNDTVSLLLPEFREQQLVETNLSHWGIFEKAFVKSTHRSKRFLKCALMGTGLKTIDRPALYLIESFNPLAVVGNTKIKGNVILPLQGVRSGNISGNSYYGTQLIYGDIHKSDTILPKLKYDYKPQLKYYLNEYEPQNVSDFIPLGQGGQITNSFKASGKGYFSKVPLVLKNTSICGNIIIRSSESITVRNTAILKDIILSAPIIIIEDGVNGNFQAIADTTIKIGKDCSLFYPSALIMVEKENRPEVLSNEFGNKIFVDTGSVIRGSICYFDTKRGDRDFKVNIFIGIGSFVKGEIYCEGNLELKGSNVVGTVYTKNFVANESGSTFVNHLYNASINSEELPESFGGILFENRSKSVMKWLY